MTTQLTPGESPGGAAPPEPLDFQKAREAVKRTEAGPAADLSQLLDKGARAITDLSSRVPPATTNELLTTDELGVGEALEGWVKGLRHFVDTYTAREEYDYNEQAILALVRALSGLPQPTPSEAATEAVYEMFEFHGYHRSGVVPKVGQLALSAAYRAQFGSPPSPPKEG